MVGRDAPTDLAEYVAKRAAQSVPHETIRSLFTVIDGIFRSNCLDAGIAFSSGVELALAILKAEGHDTSEIEKAHRQIGEARKRYHWGA